MDCKTGALVRTASVATCPKQRITEPELDAKDEGKADGDQQSDADNAGGGSSLKSWPSWSAVKPESVENDLSDGERRDTEEENEPNWDGPSDDDKNDKEYHSHNAGGDSSRTSSAYNATRKSKDRGNAVDEADLFCPECVR